MELAEYERLTPNVVVDGIIFLTPNLQCKWRADTLYTKEPDTIAWIRTMSVADTLFDIGANIGQYTMFAAKRGVRVHAFEPESQNFALLCRNLAINKLGERATAWPLALMDAPSFDLLNCSALLAGGSCHSFKDSLNYEGAFKQFPFSHGSVATTLDLFCAERSLSPTHIKIDVDGFEHQVLRGGRQTLAHVRSILVETNTRIEGHRGMISELEAHGFTYDPAQVESSIRKDGPFKGIGNYIWTRK